MIVNGASRRSVAFWARHLQNDKKNDRAELKEIRGLGATNLKDALLEMQEDARHTRCENFFYQANFNPASNERLTEEQWQRAFEIFEKHRGIPPGQARVVYEHEKEGRVHRHVIWSRIDLETMKAWPDRLDAKICHAASREIAAELGLQHAPSPYDKDREGERPKRAPKSYEMFRGLRSGLDPREIKAEVTRMYRESRDAAEFVERLRQQGYGLARGDRRDFCIIDSAGDAHSLARRIDGVNARQLRAFLKDIDLNALPGVEKARLRQRERNLDDRKADLATVQREIAWEEKLAKAGIEKEEREGRFQEPTAREQGAQDRREKKWPVHPPRQEPVATSPRWHFEDAAREAGDSKRKPVRREDIRGLRAEIWDAWQGSENVRAFTHKLSKEGIALAAVTKEDADHSFRVASFARATGRYAPTYRQGEIVAITRDGRVFQLNRRTTGKGQAVIEEFLKPLDRAQLQGIEAIKAMQARRHDARIAEIQGFRDVLREMKSAERMDKATNIRVKTRKTGAQRTVKSIKVAAGAFGAVAQIAEGLIGIFDPELTPAQKIEARIAQAERDAEAQQHVSFARYTAARATEQQREQVHRREERERDR
jgi:hypothetical protein